MIEKQFNSSIEITFDQDIYEQISKLIIEPFNNEIFEKRLELEKQFHLTEKATKDYTDLIQVNNYLKIQI